MNLLILFICLGGVSAIKKCRSHCEDSYRPVCGHDSRHGYNTFCNLEALDKCNLNRGHNYTKIADGPCYPSVREWSSQPDKKVVLTPHKRSASLARNLPRIPPKR